MFVALGFLAFFLVLNIAALTGWAPSTRDSRDWARRQAPSSRRGPVHLPAAWSAAAASGSTPAEPAGQQRHSRPSLGVDSTEPGGPRPDAARETHAVAA